VHVWVHVEVDSTYIPKLTSPQDDE